MSIEKMDAGEPPADSTVIHVMGVGGCGGSVVDLMVERQVRGARFICANTDALALSRARADVRIGLDCHREHARMPERCKDAAEAGADDIRKALRGAHMLLVIAGMGGATGMGAAPVVARIAREMGIFTVGVATMPFNFENSMRLVKAEAGLAKLQAHVDSLLVVPNEKALEMLGEDFAMEKALACANDVIGIAVGGIVESINNDSLVNVNFEDVRTVLSQPGRAMMGTATASGPERARIAAEQAAACPLLGGGGLSGAKGALVLVAASRGSLKLKEVKTAMDILHAYASSEAKTIFGALYDDSLGDALRVTVIANRIERTSEKPSFESCGGIGRLRRWATRWRARRRG